MKIYHLIFVCIIWNQNHIIQFVDRASNKWKFRRVHNNLTTQCIIRLLEVEVLGIEVTMSRVFNCWWSYVRRNEVNEVLRSS